MRPATAEARSATAPHLDSGRVTAADHPATANHPKSDRRTADADHHLTAAHRSSDRPATAAGSPASANHRDADRRAVDTGHRVTAANQGSNRPETAAGHPGTTAHRGSNRPATAADHPASGNHRGSDRRVTAAARRAVAAHRGSDHRGAMVAPRASAGHRRSGRRAVDGGRRSVAVQRVSIRRGGAVGQRVPAGRPIRRNSPEAAHPMVSHRRCRVAAQQHSDALAAEAPAHPNRATATARFRGIAGYPAADRRRAGGPAAQGGSLPAGSVVRHRNCESARMPDRSRREPPTGPAAASPRRPVAAAGSAVRDLAAVGCSWLPRGRTDGQGPVRATARAAEAAGCPAAAADC